MKTSGISEGAHGVTAQTEVCSTMATGGGKPGQGYAAVYVKVSRARHKDGEGERWARQDVSPTLNLFDLSGDTRACTLVIR